MTALCFHEGKKRRSKNTYSISAFTHSIIFSPHRVTLYKEELYFTLEIAFHSVILNISGTRVNTGSTFICTH